MGSQSTNNSPPELYRSGDSSRSGAYPHSHSGSKSESNPFTNALNSLVYVQRLRITLHPIALVSHSFRLFWSHILSLSVYGLRIATVGC